MHLKNKKHCDFDLCAVQSLIFQFRVFIFLLLINSYRKNHLKGTRQLYNKKIFQPINDFNQ